jgi:peroxin-12
MEYLSALQGTIDDAKPSLFEILSEQQLSSLIPPSLRYLLAVATHQHPRYLLRVLNSFDELYALLMLLVERHFLKTHGGGFTENFYGLKREKALVGELPRAQIGAPALVRESLKLSERDIWKNLLVMVGIPYLKRKLDEAYDINAPRALLGSAYTSLPPNPTVRQRIAHYYRWFLTNVYPSVNAAYYFSTLAFSLAYLFDNSKYHSPFMWLIGTRIRRMGEADYRAIAELSAVKPKAGAPPGPRSIFNPRELGPRLLSSASVLLPTSIFALKFLEWWYASDFARQLSKKATEGLETPPPVVSGQSKVALGRQTEAQAKTAAEKPDGADDVPENPPIAALSLLPILTVPLPPTTDLCPICQGPIETATACQTGYVYCYTCIHRWVNGEHDKQDEFMKKHEGKWESGKGRCAVTGRKVLGGTEGLRRVMV